MKNNWSSLFYLEEIQTSNFGLVGKGKIPTAPGHIAQGVQTISSLGKQEVGFRSRVKGWWFG